MNRTKYTDWADRVQLSDVESLDQQRQLFNTSAMYLTTDTFSNQLIRFQKKFNVRGFYIAQKGILHALVCYLVNEEFEFVERLNELLHRFNSAGLYDLWTRQEFAARDEWMTRIKLGKNLNKTNVVDVNEFPVPMIVVYCWCASIFLFMFEIVWFKWIDLLSIRILKLRKIFRRLWS